MVDDESCCILCMKYVFLDKSLQLEYGGYFSYSKNQFIRPNNLTPSLAFCDNSPYFSFSQISSVIKRLKQSHSSYPVSPFFEVPSWPMPILAYYYLVILWTC